MNVLIACEESQRVCTAFRKRGHNAFSCDIIEPSGGHPEWHILGDALVAIEGGRIVTMDGVTHDVGRWDLLIAHPPCTYLSNAGNAHRNRPGRKEKTERASEFFMRFIRADVDRIAVENPVGVMNSLYRKADQTIHPYYFAEQDDPENYQMKRTCLWLKNLPLLEYDRNKPKPEPYFVTVRADGTRKNRYFVEGIGGCKDRQKIRSKTFPVIAEAMAEQWGSAVLPPVPRTIPVWDEEGDR